MSFLWPGPAFRSLSIRGLSTQGRPFSRRSFSRPSFQGPVAQNLSAAAMGALLLASASKHFRDPGFYREVVPDYLCRQDPAPDTHQGSGDQSTGDQGNADQGTGDAGTTAQHPLALLSRDEWIAVSGLLELAAAVGILLPPTRKLTATALTAMFTAFLAGHVDALVRAYGPAGTPRRRKIHTVRLPLQAPLILWAWSLRKPALPTEQHGGRV